MIWTELSADPLLLVGTATLDNATYALHVLNVKSRGRSWRRSAVNTRWPECSAMGWMGLEWMELYNRTRVYARTFGMHALRFGWGGVAPVLAWLGTRIHRAFPVPALHGPRDSAGSIYMAECIFGCLWIFCALPSPRVACQCVASGTTEACCADATWTHGVLVLGKRSEHKTCT